MDSYEIEQAKEAMEWAEDETLIVGEAQLWFFAKAQAYAAIAQAEQTKRLADAAERQATATEKRNELLIAHNETFAKSVETSNSQRDKVLDKIFGSKEE